VIWEAGINTSILIVFLDLGKAKDCPVILHDGTRRKTIDLIKGAEYRPERLEQLPANKSFAFVGLT
jgi:hypothetical protein